MGDIAKFLIVSLALATVECVYVYSSFWAPLFDSSILNYRVDATFDPEAGKLERAKYEEKFGYRGEYLVANLGRGQAPKNEYNKDLGDVDFYFTSNA